MEEKKERTIEKARQYFHKYWYRKSSLSDLIAEVGISKPTFYNYFKNKEELFNTVMLVTYNELQYEYSQRSKSAANAMEKLDIFVRTYAWFLEAFPIYRDLYRPGNDLLPRWIQSRGSRDVLAEGVATIRAIIEDGKEEGIFRQDLQPAEVAPILYNSIVLLLSVDPALYTIQAQAAQPINLDAFLKVLAQGLLARNQRSAS
jgi:AcrR family transcriptional regulator